MLCGYRKRHFSKTFKPGFFELELGEKELWVGLQINSAEDGTQVLTYGGVLHFSPVSAASFSSLPQSLALPTTTILLTCAIFSVTTLPLCYTKLLYNSVFVADLGFWVLFRSTQHVECHDKFPIFGRGCSGLCFRSRRRCLQHKVFIILTKLTNSYDFFFFFF